MALSCLISVYLLPQKVLAAAQGYDLASVSKETIATLLGSSDARDKAFGATLRAAKATYASDLAAGARIVVSTSAGNSGYPVLTYVPADYDPTKATRVHTHYHGWASNVADGPRHGAGRTNRMREIAAADPQCIWVLPECKNAPAKGATNWSNVTSQARTTRDALAVAGVATPTYRTLSAHSGGGMALFYAAKADATGAGIEADRMECLDCFYDMEKTLVTWAATAAGQALKNLIYVRGTNTNSDFDVATAFAGRYDRFEFQHPDEYIRHNGTNFNFLDTYARQLPSTIRTAMAADAFVP